MDKCIASENGVCRNLLGYGTPCDGYSDKCSLKPRYDAINRLIKDINESIKRTLGIKGDRAKK